MARRCVGTARRNLRLAILLALVAVTNWLVLPKTPADAFLQKPAALPSYGRQDGSRHGSALRRLATTSISEDASRQSADTPAKKADAAAPAGKKGEKEDIDDAVLAMAAAMTEEDEFGPRKTKKAKKEEPFRFDLQNIITGFWVFLIIYSFGSVFIAFAQGRIQDRSGGDFTAYDFFDNIFAFSEWDIEYTLGFNPLGFLPKFGGD